MAKRNVKFKIFKISNLITEKNTTTYNYYNHRIVDFILLNILSHQKKDRKKTYNHKTETVYLLNYNPYFNSEYSHGEIVTIRHGKEQRNVDVEDLSLVGLIKTNQGIEYKMDFFIHKQKGFMFVEQDENFVLTISKLRTLLRQFKHEVRLYIKYLNSLNNIKVIEDKPYITIEIVKPMDIKKQIEKLTQVKSVSLFEKSEVHDGDIEDIQFDQETDDDNFFKLVSEMINIHGLGDYETVLKLTKFKKNKFSGELEKFINYILESDKFGSYSIEGIDAYGVNRIFTPDSITRDIQFETEVDQNGYVSTEEKLNFINKYFNDNNKNMPETKLINEPDYKNNETFLRLLNDYKEKVKNNKKKKEEKKKEEKLIETKKFEKEKQEKDKKK